MTFRKKLYLCLCLTLILLPARSVRAAESELTYHSFSLGNETIAPGQSSEYHIILNNSAEQELDYILSLEPTGPDDIPLRMKLKQGEQYLLGTKNTWTHIDSVTDVHGTVQGNTTEEIILIWEWQYYTNARQDQTDTRYGQTGSDSVGFLINLNIAEDEDSVLKKTAAIPVLGDDSIILKWSLAAFMALCICPAAKKRGGAQ